MNTFTPERPLVPNRGFAEQRQRWLAGLDGATIDRPLVKIVNRFNRLDDGFTLQCCYGHFLYDGQPDRRHIGPLPAGGPLDRVVYRIAYVAFCVADSDGGRRLLRVLRDVPDIDPSNVQFGCADWFWQQQVNSYVLQVEPERFKDKDRAVLDAAAAYRIETVRNGFFARLETMLQTC